MALYKYVRNIDINNYTTSIELERNAAGEVIKSIGVGEVKDLTDLEYGRASVFAVLEPSNAPALEDKPKSDNKSDKPQSK